MLVQNFGTPPYSPDLAPSESLWSKEIDLILKLLFVLIFLYSVEFRKKYKLI
jgi:transposase